MKAAGISRRELREEVKAWAARIGVEPRRVQVRELREYWASCSPGGTITFDPGLLLEPKPFRDSVVVHELLHLIVPNHGKVFTALNRTYLREGAISSRRQASTCRYER